MTIDQSPKNLWQLIADPSAWPTDDELTQLRLDAQGGTFSNLGTCPKAAEVGDLALLYFQARITAVWFVASSASRPIWDDSIRVNAVSPVSSVRWRVRTTVPIELEPIPYKELRAASGGPLVLRGRTGKRFPATARGDLTFNAANSTLQCEIDRITRP